MLISPNTTKSKTTEWEQLEKLSYSFEVMTPAKFKEENQVLYEYERFVNTITTEWIQQTEFFSKLQKSHAKILFNSISMWSNFFQLNLNVNNKLIDNYSKIFFGIGIVKK